MMVEIKSDNPIAEWHLQNWARWMRREDAVTKGYPDKSVGFSASQAVGADYWEITCDNEDEKSAGICWTIIKDDLAPMHSAVIQNIHLASVYRMARVKTMAEMLALYEEAVKAFWRKAQSRGLS